MTLSDNSYTQYNSYALYFKRYKKIGPINLNYISHADEYIQSLMLDISDEVALNNESIHYRSDSILISANRNINNMQNLDLIDKNRTIQYYITSFSEQVKCYEKNY